MEIDFFIKRDSEIVAVEVKSADNTKSKSLNSLLENKEWIEKSYNIISKKYRWNRKK